MAQGHIDPIVAEVRTAREKYAAALNHDISAIFRELRRTQKTPEPICDRHVEPLNQTDTPSK